MSRTAPVHATPARPQGAGEPTRRLGKWMILVRHGDSFYGSFLPMGSVDLMTREEAEKDARRRFGPRQTVVLPWEKGSDEARRSVEVREWSPGPGARAMGG